MVANLRGLAEAGTKRHKGTAIAGPEAGYHPNTSDPGWSAGTSSARSGRKAWARHVHGHPDVPTDPTPPVATLRHHVAFPTMTAADDEQRAAPGLSTTERLIDHLFRSEAPRLVRFLRRSVRNHDEVHDLVQEAFANLVAVAPSVPLRTPEAYLRTIARNLLSRRSRRHAARNYPVHVPVDEALEITVDPEQEWVMEAADLMRRYQEALAELPARTREVFRLHRQEELSYQQIAERTGLTVRGVKYHMKKALHYLDHRVNSDD